MKGKRMKSATMLNAHTPRFKMPNPLTPFGNGNGQPKATKGDGRDQKGRFAKGWKGGPGNPFSRRVADLRKALFDAVSAEDVQAIAQKLANRAKKGDVAAAKLLLSYLIGKPAAAVNPDRLDLEEMEFFRSLPEAEEMMEVLTNRIGADAVCGILQGAIPMLTKEFFRKVAEHLRDR
jgi:hypothetical protein